MARLAVAGMVAFLMMGLLVIPVAGVDSETVLDIPSDFEDVQNALPDEIRDQLPEGMGAESAEEKGEALSQMLTPTYFFEVLKENANKAFGGGVRLFATLCGLLILCAVFQTLRSSLASDMLRNTVRFCTVGGVFATILQIQYDQLLFVVRFFERLHSLMAAMIPVGGSLLAMGGNVSTATAGTATLGVFLSVSEGLCSKTVVPVCAIGTAFALIQALCPELGVRGLAGALRKTYTFTIGFIMSMLCFLLSSQTTLCAAADSTGARAAKLVSGMAIPVVGGSVGETLRTVAGSVQYLKSIVGFGGILFILLLLLPTLLSLLFTRLALLLCSGVADMLGCESEGKLLSELGTVFGTMIAVVAMCSVMFILSLVIFVRIAVAVG